MSMPIATAISTATRLLEDRPANIAAQTDARHILQEVGESVENYPKYDAQLTDKAVNIAYVLVACGCSIVEQTQSGDTEAGIALSYLEKAGKIITDAFKNNEVEPDNREYNLLIAGMSLYAAKHYSRAFLALKGVSVDFGVGQLVAAFVKKDFTELRSRVTEMFFAAPPADGEILSTDIYVIEHEVARCFMLVSDYIYSGESGNLDTAKEILSSLLELAAEDRLSYYWLIIRLLRIMFGSFQQSSLWERLPPYFPKSGRLAQYIRRLSGSKLPAIEIWDSQIAALDMALGDNKGAVINLRTSGGKTRIAELAMLKALSENPVSKVLYLAPFRSLAFELEQSLHRIFSPLGLSVTHLYGGASISLSDFELIETADIIIATPEKAKALIRGGSGIESSLNLIVVDEGHLLGLNERDVRNEMFLTHLSRYAAKNNVRILLLSAVLPNADDLAEWITGDRSLVAKSDWKPSLERTGFLLWDGKSVRLNWIGGEKPPFNPYFVQQQPISERKNSKKFPNSKNEAIAATAVRLSRTGTVLIFSGMARSIEGLDDSVLFALRTEQGDFSWNKNLWDKFESVCVEELGSDHIVLKAARKGVICHSNKLPTLVRNAIERLMRSKQPKIIIATSTLGQGVNVGISSVIVTNPYRGENDRINTRDFWNICGRAGRAYTDTEGKILYAIDRTENNFKVKKNVEIARNYFNADYEPVESGVLGALRKIKEVAAYVDVSFELLVEAIANDFSDSSMHDDGQTFIKYVLDLIDDELLAMHEDYTDFLDSIDWVETIFRESLAFIQAKEEERQQLLALLKARVSMLRQRVPKKAERQAIIATGVPFSVSVALLKDAEIFRNIAETAITIDSIFPHIDNSLKVIKQIEEWVFANASTLINEKVEKAHKQLTEADADMVRKKWVVGTDLAIISDNFKDSEKVIDGLYGFIMPWVIHAISRLFAPETDEEIQKFYSRLALLVELGVPSETAANVYLSGIHSRSVAVELAGLDSLQNASLIEMKPLLIALAENADGVSDNAKIWLGGYEQYNTKQHKQLTVRSFSFTSEAPDRLLVRVYNDGAYLLSADGYFQTAQISGDVGVELKAIANRPDVYFERRKDDAYHLCSYNLE
ncbi:hypothetical protein FACS1894208_06500 [Clostridia bacterium]|nr:hypothetical protein FACS1894208_06500 [Clostridia bacterium]